MGEDLGRPGERQRTIEQQDVESRRLAMARALFFGVFIWSSFFALDVYVVFLIGAERPLYWFAAVRVIGIAPILAGRWLALRARRPAGLMFAGLISIGGAAFFIAVMATWYGGLNSRYIQGVSIAVMYLAAFAPDRWQRALFVSLATALQYPLVMGVVALFLPSVRAQWRTPAALALFIHDYLFVLAIAVIAAAASHFVWAARRQVFEARKLGRYRLKVRIGVGGSGEVWLAGDETMKKNVALKILNVDAAQRAGARARFEREARAAQTLHDPHTIRVFDYGASDDGVCYIAMELLDGADLATLVKLRGPMPSERAIHFGRQACASLAEAHDHGILHRDVKPENLFATRDAAQCDHLKLLDFGLAKMARPEDDVTLTQAGWLGGTPAYMAPEVCAGGEAVAASDLYSLGAVLYYLVTGSPPFTSDSAGALMLAHANEPPTPPSKRVPVPPELERVILRCLAKRPAERYASARELDDALAACGVAWSEEQARAVWSLRDMPIVA